MRLEEKHLLTAIRLTIWSAVIVLLIVVACVIWLFLPHEPSKEPVDLKEATSVLSAWQAPDSTTIPQTPEGDLIRYGQELIAHTAIYLGPSGTVAQISNGMNCQNCHLKAGKKWKGNNYAAVAATYPKYRARSGMQESIEKRVNDCLERSLNGQPLEQTSHEMKAMVAYIRWVGSGVRKEAIPAGTGITDLSLLDRTADGGKGKFIFSARCSRCHGLSGEGLRKPGSNEWLYPPLWGEGSFNNGAGLLRLSRLAGFIHDNMPYDSVDSKSKLTTAEAWDVAAFISAQPRPARDFSLDWPNITEKPFDHPFGPYPDDFTEEQHRFGPFGPIVQARKKD
ncbi:MAG: c-type cytochrome [Cyclobacteriaceae bacterium]|nr:c-type cytochrome [Cyclobacteriaceae bacterium]